MNLRSQWPWPAHATCSIIHFDNYKPFIHSFIHLVHSERGKNRHTINDQAQGDVNVLKV